MLKQKSNIKAAHAHLLSSVLSSKKWEFRTGKADVKLLTHIPETILAKQQWNNRNYALNLSKLLSSQLLPKYHLQLFCHEDRWVVPQVGQEFIQPPSQEVFNTQLGKALRSLVWPQSWPCFEPKTRVENLLRLLPHWIILLSYAVYAGIWVLFFCSKFIRHFFIAGIFPSPLSNILLGIMTTGYPFTQFITFFWSHHQ